MLHLIEKMMGLLRLNEKFFIFRFSLRYPELIKIFDALHTPLPNNRRRALLCELAIILYDDVPQIPLLALPDLYAINDRLQGVMPNTYDTITWNAAEWHLTPPQE